MPIVEPGRVVEFELGLRWRAWLGEVAALEESLKHLRQRRAEAETQLAAAAAPR